MAQDTGVSPVILRLFNRFNSHFSIFGEVLSCLTQQQVTVSDPLLHRRDRERRLHCFQRAFHGKEPVCFRHAYGQVVRAGYVL